MPGGGGGSSSGGKTVSVSGYYRSNGTYVSGYTRSASGCGNSCSSSLTSGSHASTSHTRASLGTNKPTCSGVSNSSVEEKTVYVKEHVKGDGTVVSGHWRKPPSFSKSSSSTNSGSGTNPEKTVYVKEHVKGDGTVVSGHWRKPPSFSKSSSSTNSGSGINPEKTVYVKEHFKGDGTIVSGYWRKPPRPRTERLKKLQEKDYPLDDLKRFIENLRLPISDPERGPYEYDEDFVLEDYQYAIDEQKRARIEEAKKHRTIQSRCQ